MGVVYIRACCCCSRLLPVFIQVQVLVIFCCQCLIFFFLLLLSSFCKRKQAKNAFKAQLCPGHFQVLVCFTSNKENAYAALTDSRQYSYAYWFCFATFPWHLLLTAIFTFFFPSLSHSSKECRNKGSTNWLSWKTPHMRSKRCKCVAYVLQTFLQSKICFAPTVLEAKPPAAWYVPIYHCALVGQNQCALVLCNT